MLSTPFFPASCHSTRVSIIGAGKVGSTLAQRIVEQNIANVVLLDVLEGVPQGIALDLMQAGAVERHDRHVTGTNNYEDTAGSDIVVITAGKPRIPGMSRDDLISINAKIVAEAAKKSIEYSPDAVLIIVTNPLDIMTYIAWKVTQVEPHRIMGMAGVLDSARFEAFLGIELGMSVSNIDATVLGSHGDLMVPLPRYTTVNGIPITELIEPETINKIVERTRKGGGEIVELLKTGGAYFAPASSVRIMVESILRQQSRLLPTCCYLQGQYGLNDIFLGVPAWLGCRGVERVLELDLTESEHEALMKCAESVREGINQALEMITDN
ncbi:malate dehydrogenase [Planktothrix sp. FACHB-1365]|uniref:malate dehydrogenase n=1 Tax=Planktothrix sp. FACHB-1365 TaxID=2692855 RepID=UPI0016848607|nr:malate dehydrogenase [Planktothrix sp. FACHB-1365]MBD2484241.1 malate dehydrogenase [Planktothrix sp. FACHB-1365]